MSKFYFFILSFILVVIILLLSKCIKDKPVIIQVDTVEVIKERVIVREKEVIKWKEKKAEIHYRTKFDTLVTIDTVYKELIKCDSVVRIDSVIIAVQDTIIRDQKEVINILETDNQAQKKEVKRQKRIALITKIISGVAIVVSIILL
jgi:hypothetical protein